MVVYMVYNSVVVYMVYNLGPACVTQGRNWVLGFPECPQDPIYPVLGPHMGVVQQVLG